ncbi:uncharacterized protein LOC128882626 isoform X2 [Hylaeus volcanicus]|uniref:uncharacterized protein LOC128882626 isoform X2 n=1 Tax=Hylaeus volcanicus TaxID=313075 RepID=UPI0023B7CC29|nr:uncharacterized protein LOC128882626 isoform X2 [Hylaeus volcanicus]
MQLEKKDETKIKNHDPIYSYFLTLQQPTNSIACVVLQKPVFLKTPTKKQSVLVIARSNHLDFYYIRKTLWNGSTNDLITKKSVLFSTPIYTPIETMLGWYPSKNFQCSYPKGEAKTIHSHLDSSLHQDGLVLLSKSLRLYLVIPHYTRQTVQVLSTINLNELSGVNIETQPLIAIDPFSQYLFLYVHNMTFYLIKINYYERKSLNKPAFWKLESPKIFKSSRIVPTHIMFYCEKYFRKDMKRMSYKKKYNGRNPVIKNCHNHIYPALFHEAKTLKKSRFKKIKNDMAAHFKCLLYILYEQKQCHHTSNADFYLEWINVKTLLSKNTPELLDNSKNVVLSPTPLCVIKTDGFILVIKEKQICLYNISPRLECQFVYLMAISDEAHLIPPVKSFTLHSSNKRWLITDAIGKLFLLVLTPYHSFVPATVSCQKDSPLHFLPIGLINPISNLVLLDYKKIKKYNPLFLKHNPPLKKKSYSKYQYVIYMGSKTGDHLILCFSLINNWSIKQTISCQILKTFPNFSPIIDIACSKESKSLTNQLIFTTGFSNEGKIRVVSNGNPFSSQKCVYKKSLPYFFSVISQRRHGCLDSLLLFKCLPLQHNQTIVSIIRRDFQKDASLMLQTLPHLPTFLLHTPFLYIGDIVDSPFFIFITTSTVMLIDSLSFEIIRSIGSNDSVFDYNGPKQFSFATGDETTFIVAMQHSLFIFLSIDSLKPTCHLCINTEIQAADISEHMGIVSVLDWNGSLFIYAITREKPENIPLKIQCLLTYQFTSSHQHLSIPCSLTQCNLLPCELFPRKKTFLQKWNVFKSFFVIIVGFSDGTLQCLIVSQKTESNKCQLNITHVRHYFVGTSPIRFKKIFTVEKKFNLEKEILIICDSPALLRRHHLLRFYFVPLNIPYLFDAVIWNYKTTWLLQKKLPISITKTYKALKDTITNKEDLFTVCGTRKALKNCKDFSFFISNNIVVSRNFFIKSIPIDASPDRLAYHKEHSLILVAALKESMRCVSFSKELSSRIIIIDSETFKLDEQCLASDEFPTSLQCCYFPKFKKEFVLLGSTKMTDPVKGCFRIFALRINQNIHHKRHYNLPAITKNKQSKNSCKSWLLEPIIEENTGGVSALAHQREYIIIACSNRIKIGLLRYKKYHNEIRVSNPIETDSEIYFELLKEYTSHCFIHTIHASHKILIVYLTRSFGVYSLNIDENNIEECELIEMVLDSSSTWTNTAIFADCSSNIYMTNTSNEIISFEYEEDTITSLQTNDINTKTTSDSHRKATLFKKASIDTGNFIQCFASVTSPSDVVNYPEQHTQNLFLMSHKTFWGSNQGAFGVICGLKKNAFTLLIDLQHAILPFINFPLGYNETSDTFLLKEKTKNSLNYEFVNGDILEQLLDFPLNIQEEIFTNIQNHEYYHFESLSHFLCHIHQITRRCI